MRLGIFGGSFDPIHNGHLQVAEACRQQAELDRVWFMPAATQPLKAAGPRASDVDRCQMLKIALADKKLFELSTLEIDRGGISYTVDTLELITREWPDAELFFLLGVDTLHDLPRWHKPETICKLATLLVVGRAGEKLRTADLPANATIKQVEMPPVEISSTAIREAVAAGKPIDDFVPRYTARYIAKYQLYQDKT